MRKFLSMLFIIVLGIMAGNLYGQINNIPYGIDTNTVNPENIPSAEKLKSLGASEAEIKQIIEFKKRKLKDVNHVEINTNDGVENKKAISDNEIKHNRFEDKLDTTLQKPIIIDTEKEREEIFGHSFFLNNNIRFYDKANQIRAPDHYVLGVGDDLSIAIWGFSDYNASFTISNDGAINPKLVGKIYLSGLTFKDAKALIESKFSRVYNLSNSQIDVTLTNSRVITVNIVGEINNPGAYTIPAINTAFNALVTVGGIRKIGSVRNIYIKRAGKIIKKLDIYEYLLNPNSKQDFFLENNDYIFVPTSEKVVEISGHVKRPSNYELIEGENLKSIIEYAGGFEAGAYKGQIQITRFLNDEEIIVDIDYDSLTLLKKDFILFNGDRIKVRKIEQEYINYVDIKGPVKQPGRYEIKSGDKISDIINRAEGLLYDVFDSRAYIIRQNDDFSKKYIPFNLNTILTNEKSGENIKLERFDIISIFSKSYFKDNFTFSVSGAVREAGKYLYGNGLTLKDALYMAGGLKKEADNSKIEITRAVEYDFNSNLFTPIKTKVEIVTVNKDLLNDKISEAYIIQPYDQIHVRTDPSFESPENVILRGEVVYPGVYTLTSKNEKISNVISRAGGLTEWSFTQGARLTRSEDNAGMMVLRLDKVVKDTNSRYNYILRAGDTLYIPKVNDLIKIRGEINNPNADSSKNINAPFTPYKSAKYYVKKYGLGFKKTAKKGNTYVQLPGGETKRTKKILFLKIYPKVRKGSSIIVVKKDKRQNDLNDREKTPIDWNKAIENGTIKMTALITLYILIQRIGN